MIIDGRKFEKHTKGGEGEGNYDDDDTRANKHTIRPTRRSR
jgi:hypothetical protein